MAGGQSAGASAARSRYGRGSPAPRSVTPALRRAPTARVRRTAAKVITWPMVPPSVWVVGGVQVVSTKVSARVPAASVPATKARQSRPATACLAARPAHRLVALVGPVAAAQRRQPVLLLRHHGVDQRAERRLLVDRLHGHGDGLVEHPLVEAARAVDDRGEGLDMVVDQVLENVHRGLLTHGRQPQATGRLEVDAAGAGQLQLAEGQRPVPPDRGRGEAVRPLEGAGERLVRAVSGLDGDVEDGPVAGDQPVRRALQEQPPTQRARRFPGGRGDQPVEVEPGQVGPGGHIRRTRRRIVERDLEYVEQAGESVVPVHALSLHPGRTVPLDRRCAPAEQRF